MSEVLFYHLQNQPLEAVLPRLLEACVERQWRTVVQVGSDERLDAIDAALWTYRDEAFLAHGTDREEAASIQPILLTTGPANPNEAVVRFCVDGAETNDASSYRRVVYLFDGNDAEAIERARASWKRFRAEGHEVTYWQQGEGGRWEKKG